MKSISCIIIFSLLSALPARSQDTLSTDSTQAVFLQDYYRQFLKRSTLESSLSTRSIVSSSSAERSTTSSTENSQHDIALSAAYTHFLNDTTRQRTLSSSLGTTFNSSRSEQTATNSPPDINSSKRTTGRLSINYTDRKFNQNNGFLELRPFLQFNTFHRTTSNTSSNTTSILAGGRVAYGKGRIEDISDAWSAQRIIEDLTNANVLNRKPNEEEYWELADLIAELRNLRRLDFRMKRVYELTVLGEYLIDAGFTDASDILFMAQLADTYRFERFVLRSSGQSWKVYTAVLGSIEKLTGRPSDQDSKWEVGAQYEYRRPINQIWQLDFIADFNYKPEAVRIPLVPGTENFEGSISAILGYYPNARTNIDFRLIGEWRNTLGNPSIPEATDYLLDLSIDGSYFISPFVSINGSLNYRHSTGNIYTPISQLNTDNRLDFSVRFQYIFY